MKLARWSPLGVLRCFRTADVELNGTWWACVSPLWLDRLQCEVLSRLVVQLVVPERIPVYMLFTRTFSV